MKLRIEPIFILFIIGIFGAAFLAVEMDKERNENCNQPIEISYKVK